MIVIEELLTRLNRKMPESEEAEKGLLSCLFQEPGRLSECRINVPPEAFYHECRRIIYEVMLDMRDKSQPIGGPEVTHVLRERGVLDKVGGPAGVSDLYSFTPIAAHFPFWVRILREKLTLRQLIEANAQSMWMAFEHGTEQNDDDVANVVSASQELVFAVNAEQASGDGGVEYRQVALDVVESVERQLNQPAVIPEERVPIGFTDIDRRVWGFVRGQLFILAARPSMGKSALAMNICANVARGLGHYDEWSNDPRWPHRKNKRVIVFNLEMTNTQSVTRDVVGGAGLDLQAMRYGMPVREAQEKLGRRVREVADSNIRMYDRPGTSIQRMRAICRAQARKKPIDLIMVDYLQLMSSESKKAQQNREREIAEISAGLKEMAKELNCVVLALAQLNRSAEERKEKKPTLADLRESGSIEQDADVVAFLMRPSYYDEDHEDEKLAYLILAKGRDVGIGEVELDFDAPKTTFTSRTSKLLSNNDKQRERRYKSKPQPCKQQKKGRPQTQSSAEWHAEWSGGDDQPLPMEG
jgi:replicative DNA helicase